MADEYTHIFDITIDGCFARGECEFNTDGHASYKFTGLSEPIPHDNMQWFIDLMALVKKMHGDKKNQGIEIKKITIIKKLEE